MLTATTFRSDLSPLGPLVNYFSRAGFFLLHFRNGWVDSRRQPTPPTNHMITIIDPANKHNTFIYSRAMQPIGWVHCFAKTEWQAFKEDGTFIDWFTSKKAAIAAIR